MHQIDIESAVTSMVPFEPVGTPGYFTTGDQDTEVLPTRADADWWNAVMLEVKNVITGASITLDKSDRAQLYKAIYKLIYGTLPPTPSGDYYDNPFAANTQVIGIANHTGSQVLFQPPGSGADIRGEVILHADEVNVSDALILNENAVSVEGFSDNPVFTLSDVIVPTQHAVKQYIDDYDPDDLPLVAQSYVFNGEFPQGASVPAGTTVYMGFHTANIISYPISRATRPTAGTLKNLYVRWKPGLTITGTFTLYVNGSSTALTVTVTSDSSGAAQALGSVSANPSADFQLRIDTDAGSANDIKWVSWSIAIVV